MKKYIFAGWLMVCTGCGGESLTSGPNPLETYDQDRLYVLINGTVSRGRAAECARYFQEADNQAADNPKAGFIGAALSQICPESMVKIAAYLEHNGVAGVKADHVKDLAFWERMKTKDKAADAARKQEILKVAAAARECRRKVSDRERRRREGQPALLLKDFPSSQAYRAAWDEAREQEQGEKKKYRAEREACGSGQWRPPGREELGISLPEGMRVNAGGRIN